ncbi:hypothetical protein EZS27_026367 [termite gut metagenome]|uniref:SusD/RagB family nutrient-binding outer membrane lipoprotein n=1 Tax=termite gut metagenome TaxID=433724 RepID=A0A5J4QSH3_9ZZZZ
MKKSFIQIGLPVLIGILLFHSCELDINTNPNSPTETVVTPDLTLPAVVGATVYNQIYYYGYASAAYLVGHQIPGKGVSGFGDVYTYNFTSSFVTGAWTSALSALRDYGTIIRKSENDSGYVLYGAIAHILTAYNYQLLVDAYGDVPYTEGLNGASGNLSPVYDSGADVYKALISELNDAISLIKDNRDNVGGGVLGLNSSTDPVFGGNLTKWIQFANNIKLRLLVRARGTTIDSFVKDAFSKFSSDGFLKEDVLVNPGYNSSSQQNPYWTVFHSSVDGTITQPARFFIPSKYVFSFYDGTKLDDKTRGKLVYKGFPNTPTGQLADETNNPATQQYTWFIGTGTGRTASDAAGILKSRSAAAPLFFASETYFLLAEAALYDYLSSEGDAKTNFVKGIEASFAFLEKEGAANTLPSGANPSQDTQDYITTNSSSYLANFDIAGTTDQKLEAIITQKYIALNILNSNEAWNEFRRTGYPKISGSDALTTFVSIRSQSTRADKLPVRLIYPQTEFDLNANTPQTGDAYSNPVFWDKD